MRLATSPYNTRQEQYRDDPWKMMMICFMLNQTSHKQVDQIRDEFFSKFPTAESIVLAKDEEIIEIIRPLGFYNRRASAWKEFSLQWIDAVRKHGSTNIPVYELEKMRGVGKYALDSWKVFQLYDYDIEVQDHVLNWYVDWARVEKERLIREASPWKPYSVYYVHYKDDRFVENNWNKCRDYVCCVMARTQKEAIESTELIALNQKKAIYIKILGVGHCKEEWTQLPQPMTTDEEFYSRSIDVLRDKIKKDPSVVETFLGVKK
jgi:hypothetical protein